MVQGGGAAAGGQRSASASAGYVDVGMGDTDNRAMNVVIVPSERAPVVSRGGNTDNAAPPREHWTSVTAAGIGRSPAKPLRNSVFAPLRPIEFDDRFEDKQRSQRSPQSAPVALSLAPDQYSPNVCSGPQAFPRRKVSDPPSTVRRGLDFKNVGDVIFEERAGNYRPLGSQIQPAFRSLPSTFISTSGFDNPSTERCDSRDVGLQGPRYKPSLEAECDPWRSDRLGHSKPADKLLLVAAEVPEASSRERERELATIPERRGETSIETSTVKEDTCSGAAVRGAALEEGASLSLKSDEPLLTSPPKTQTLTGAPAKHADRHKFSILKEELDRSLQQLLDQIATLSTGKQLDNEVPPSRSESSECFLRQPPRRSTDTGLVASAEDMTAGSSSSAPASGKASCSEGAWSDGRSAEQLVLISTPDNDTTASRAPQNADSLSPVPTIATGEKGAQKQKERQRSRRELLPASAHTCSHSEANYTRSSNSTGTVFLLIGIS